MKNTQFPEIVNQMTKHNQKLKDMVEILGFKEKSQVCRRLAGKIEWTIGEVETLCNYYNMDFEDLFRRKEDK